MHLIELRAALAAVVVLLAVGCNSPAAPTSSGPTAPASATPSATASGTAVASSSPSPSAAASSAEDLVVVIDGVEYTCSQMFTPTGEACPAPVQARWARWASGMQAYLDSDRLKLAREVLLPPLSTQQLLAFGLAACVTAETHTDGAAAAIPDFIAFVRDGRPDADEEAVEDMFLAALQHLCQDVPLE